mgnify:CR=1 FL=1
MDLPNVGFSIFPDPVVRLRNAQGLPNCYVEVVLLFSLLALEFFFH